MTYKNRLLSVPSAASPVLVESKVETAAVGTVEINSFSNVIVVSRDVFEGGLLETLGINYVVWYFYGEIKFICTNNLILTSTCLCLVQCRQWL